MKSGRQQKNILRVIGPSGYVVGSLVEAKSVFREHFAEQLGGCQMKYGDLVYKAQVELTSSDPGRLVGSSASCVSSITGFTKLATKYRVH